MKARPALFGSLGLLIVFSLAFTVRPARGELVAKLPQVQNPFFMTMADGRLYIVENSSTAHFYKMDAKGVAFVKTFGHEGQGPGEFDFMYHIRPYKDHLDIPGSNKMARFSLEGEYIDEVKVPVGAFKGGISRLGENYIVKDFNFDDKEVTATIKLYDKNFKLIRNIGTRKEAGGINKINLVGDYYSPRVIGDQIFVIDSSKESIVTVFDKSGVQQKEIRLSLDPIKMTAALKEAILKPIREDRDLRSNWIEFEKRIYFPDATPGLDYFDVVDGKFVSRTYKYKGDSVEFAVFDSQGRELKRLFLPFTGRLSNGILFCFYQGRFYYLRENIDGEVWELHCESAW